MVVALAIEKISSRGKSPRAHMLPGLLRQSAAAVKRGGIGQRPAPIASPIPARLPPYKRAVKGSRPIAEEGRHQPACPANAYAIRVLSEQWALEVPG